MIQTRLSREESEIFISLRHIFNKAEEYRIYTECLLYGYNARSVKEIINYLSIEDKEYQEFISVVLDMLEMNDLIFDIEI